MTVLHGDCREMMRTLDANSVDAIVTDPPYGLAFMGKGWDHAVPGVDFWTEALRVAKPGAHLLAFGGTRTYHRLACAIEDAGWEMRDCLSWLYGSGFPKSHDVSKAMDKRRTEDTEPVRVICRVLRAAMDAKGMKSRHLVHHFGGCNPRLIDHWAARDTDSQPALPTWDQWCTLRDVLALGSAYDEEVWRLNGRKGTPGEAWGQRDVIGTGTSGIGTAFDHEAGTWAQGSAQTYNITAPATDAARQWQGWGTALKPAWEPIIMARKPLVGTVAANVAAHGTGGINVDGCRIAADWSTDQNARGWQGGNSRTIGSTGNFGNTGERVSQPIAAGRWPANVALDEDAAAQLGEPSRFFYVAKAARREREAGLEGFKALTVRSGLGGEMPTDDDGRDRDRFAVTARNVHPTVKPIALMRWLCRLVTPTGGLVLDPFTGSGTTGCAAVLEGFRFIGCEREAEYVAIAEARIAHWQHQRPDEPLPLFDAA